MMTLSDFWTQCLNHVRRNIPPQHFAMWGGRLSADEDEDGWLLCVPNEFVMRFVKQHFMPVILEFQKSTVPETPPMRLKVGEGKIVAAPPVSENKEPPVRAQAPRSEPETKNLPRTAGKKSDGNGLNPGYTFDELVMGNANQLAYSAGLNVCMHPGKSDHNPFCIYGGSGLGKTHLSQAVAHKVLQENDDVRVLYTHAESYLKDYLAAARNKTFDRFKNRYQSLDLLILDDVQFLSGKEKTMEEFFYLFNYLIENGRQIIITGDNRPDNIEGLTERLRTRFAGGLVVQIEPPAVEMRLEIIQKKAADVFHIDLPYDCAFFIAENIASSVRDLEGALKTIKAHHAFSRENIDLDYVKKTLKNILADGVRTVTADSVQQTVAHFYQVRPQDLLNKKRTKNLTLPRHMAMSLTRDLTSMSLADIGSAFNGRDHSTVLHACQKIDAMRKADPRIAADYENLYNMMKNN